MIIGHKKQIEMLQKIINSSCVPHALLFVGPERIGKKRVAFEFARLILQGDTRTHPDFAYLEPKDGKIQIDQIRELNWKISLKPILSNFKVAIIDDAHAMTIDAQNAFLKTLEEPRGDLVSVLITQYPELLLATLRSRCQEIKFFPPSEAEIRKFLQAKNFDDAQIKKLIEISRGRMGVIFDFLEDKEKLKEYIRREEEAEMLFRSSIFQRMEYLETVKDEDEFLEIFVNCIRKRVFSYPQEKEKMVKLLRFICDAMPYFLISKKEKRSILEILLMEI